MFEGLIIIVAVVVSIAALHASRQLRGEVANLRAELRRLQQRADRLERHAAPDVAAATGTRSEATIPADAPAYAEPRPSAEIAPPIFDAPAYAAPPPAVEPAPYVPLTHLEPAAAPEERVQAAPIPTAASEPAPQGLEQRLGARGFVWLGGACVALAGAFLVKYSIDEGLLGPTTRVALGVLLGIALLFGADYVRRRSGTIGQALAAAGVADLYASLFAAVALYDMLPTSLAFVILAGVTFLAIALALRHGPFVGLVGLAGGFITPAIVTTSEPNPAILFGYLYLLQLGALWLERQRGWWYLPAIAIGGGLCWALVPVTLPPSSDGVRIAAYAAPVYLIVVAGTVLWLKSTLRFGVPLHPEPDDPAIWSKSRQVALGTSLATSALMLIWLTVGGYQDLDWMFVLIFAAMGMAIGRFKPLHEYAGFAMAAVPGLGLLFWNLGEYGYVDMALSGDSVTRYLWISCIVGAFGIFGGFGLSWGARAPERWSLLSALYGAATLALAFWRLRNVDLLLPWSVVCLILSAVHLGFAERLNRWRLREPVYRRSFGIHVLACAGFLAAAVPLWVGREWLAVLWSLMLPLTLWVSIRIDEPWLRRSLWVGAPAVMLAVLFSGFPAGETPIFNWLAYGLGVPTACFAVAAWLARRASDLRLMLMLQGGTVILGFLLVTLEVRHLFHGSDFRFAPFGFTEAGTLILLWGVMALATWRLAEQRGEARLRWLAYGLGGIAALVTAGVVWVICNPLLVPVPVAGIPIFNTALYVFGSGCVLFAAMAYVVRKSKLDLPDRMTPFMVAGVIALIDGFLLFTFEVRHLFHGDALRDADLGFAEAGTLVLLWGLMAIAIWRWAERIGEPLTCWFAYALAAATAAGTVVLVWIVANPMLRPIPIVGLPILNTALYVFGSGFALFLAIAHMVRRSRFELPNRQIYLMLAVAIALVDGFLGISALNRHLFRGAFIEFELFSAPVRDGELYGYSVGWLLYGVFIMVMAVWRNLPPLRHAAAGIILLVVLKVFLVDASGLTGLYRVASFLGLGLTLMALGYLYQRFVLKRSGQAAAGGPIGR